MITRSSEIFKASGSDDSSQNWDGKSQDNGREVPNKDTEMEFEDHQRIVVDARKIFCSFPSEYSEKFDAAEVALWHLRSAYLSNVPGYEVWITKGIHQPTSNPHIQVKLYGPFPRNAPYVFHLNLSAGRSIKSDDSSEIDEYFYWEGVQYTVDVKVAGAKVSAAWPLTSNRVFKRARRKSICFSPDLEQRINDQNEILALAEQAKQAAAELAAKVEKEKADARAALATAKKEKEEAKFIAAGGPRKETIKKLLNGQKVTGVTDALVNKLYTGGAKNIDFSTENFNIRGVSSGLVDGKILFAGTKTSKKGAKVSPYSFSF